MTSPNGFSLPSPSQCQAVVVGGGTMGSGIAAVLVRARSRTVLVERDTSRHAAIADQVRDALALRGLEDNAGLLRIVAGLDEADWSGVHLVIESIPESLPAKQSLFAELVKLAPPRALLTSNSSSFPISAIAEGLDTQERMAGLHFFMPAYVVPLVEIVMAERSDPSLAEALCGHMKRCGMVPVRVNKDVPGFIANRLQHALGREAFALIEEGVASIEDIDAAVRYGFGFRYLAAGPLMQRDHAGLEIHCAAAQTIYPTLSNANQPMPMLAERVARGEYGMKTGSGFYAWTPESAAAERARYGRILRGGLSLIEEDLPPIEP